MPLIAHRGLWVPRGRFAQVGDSVLCDWQQGADDSRRRAILPLRDAWHSGRLLSITVPTQRDRGKVSPQVAPGFHLPPSFSGFSSPRPVRARRPAAPSVPYAGDSAEISVMFHSVRHAPFPAPCRECLLYLAFVILSLWVSHCGVTATLLQCSKDAVTR